MTGLKGQNPRQTTLWCRGWVRNRCVSESDVSTGQHRRRLAFRKEQPSKADGALLWSLRVLFSFEWRDVHGKKGGSGREEAVGGGGALRFGRNSLLKGAALSSFKVSFSSRSTCPVHGREALFFYGRNGSLFMVMMLWW